MKKHNKKQFIIVAPDTDSGKTVVTAALTKLLKKEGVNVGIMKPVQTGSLDGRSEDLDYILTQSGFILSKGQYTKATPYTFTNPCSPHLAAAQEKKPIILEKIVTHRNLLLDDFDTLLIESAGGIMTPLSNSTTNLDLIKALAIPAIVVIPNKLGAISQGLTTLALLRYENIKVAGIILNELTPATTDLEHEIYNNNQKTIVAKGKVPYLGTLRYNGLTEGTLKKQLVGAYTLLTQQEGL